MPYGKIETFDLCSRKWTMYINRVKQFIVLNEIKPELKVATLITVVGEPTYDLMCDLCAPATPESKTFDQLVDIVKHHLEPKRSDIAERHIYRQRRQRPGEELGSYLQHLKHLASTCNFGDKLEENLRDQFVSGLASDEMRSRLFAEQELTYKRAVELALALEAADRHAEASATATVAAPGGATSARADGAEVVGAARVLHIGARGAAPQHARPARQASGRPCWRCGKQHTADRCRYKNFNCDECGVRGHLRVMCKSGSGRGSSKVRGRNQFFIDTDSESEVSDFFNMCVDGSSDRPYIVNLIVGDVPIAFEVDTGSKVAAINETFYNKYFNNYEIVKCDLKLRSYTGDSIKPLGVINVSARYCDELTTAAAADRAREARGLPLYVIPGGGPPLLGRTWLRALQLNNIHIKLHHLKQEKNTITENVVNGLSNEFSDVFAERLGTCSEKFVLKLKDHEPIFYKARNLPLALREPVEKELQRLVNEGTLRKVEHSEYGTPIVPVIKKCGSIRLCGDYKITINPILKREPYPLPRIEELYATLSGGQIFSKIDLAHAYEQVLLDENSRACTTISTHIGCFEYIRTPYGLNCIPEKFQKLMEEVVRGIPNTVVFLDDICVSGVSRDDHIKNLREVFRRLQAVGLRIKLAKCEFFKSRVCYLGHIIDKNGLHPDDRKLKALLDAPHPQDVQQLRAFLGLVNYYGRFVPKLSTILQPLHVLLKKKTVWNWNSDCNKAFVTIKRILTSDNVLAHYNPKLPLVLCVDSSAYGVGGVLAHRYPDGSERPICCISRTLSDAEKSYSQLDKEALAIFFGVTKNHQYLYGRKFIIRTDHRPLSHIFGDKIGIPQTAASRLQRYAARLAAYDFTVEWVASAANAPADCLSRLPLAARTASNTSNTLEHCSYFHYLENEFPVSYRHIAEATKLDPILRKIYDYVMNGWPASCQVTQELAYFHRKDSLYIERGCIVYNYRVVVPPKYREYILRELHEGHLGVVKMKSIARNYVYWPGLDAALEELCRACAACRQQRAAPPHAPLTAWEFPLRPWLRLHADFGEYNSKHYLIIVDAHSKWIEVFHMNSTAAKFVIAKLREVFSRFGLPLQIVTDNGPPFASRELEEYFNRNGIIHSLTSPYRPKGNGAAENAVKTVKHCIKKACYEGTDVEQAVSKMLFQYRNCPHATTGVEPAVALLGRRLRGRLDLLRAGPDVTPDVAARVLARQRCQEIRAGGLPRTAEPGDSVLIRDYSRNKDKWTEGVIKERVGPASFNVTSSSGTTRRHIDQILTPKGPCAKRYSISLVKGNESACSDSRTHSVVSGGAEETPTTMTAANDVSKCARCSDASDVSSPEPTVDAEGFELASSTPPPPHRQKINLRPRLKKM